MEADYWRCYRLQAPRYIDTLTVSRDPHIVVFVKGNGRNPGITDQLRDIIDTEVIIKCLGGVETHQGAVVAHPYIAEVIGLHIVGIIPINSLVGTALQVLESL